MLLDFIEIKKDLIDFAVKENINTNNSGLRRFEKIFYKFPNISLNEVKDYLTKEIDELYRQAGYYKNMTPYYNIGVYEDCYFSAKTLQYILNNINKFL